MLRPSLSPRLAFLGLTAALAMACGEQGDGAVTPGEDDRTLGDAQAEPPRAPQPASSDAGTASDAAAATAVSLAERWLAFAEKRGAARGDLAIGIRGRDVHGVRHATRVGAKFDDTLIVVTGGTVTVFPVSTHPFEKTSTTVPDVTADGKRDVAMIRPGLYRAVLRDASRNIGGALTYHVLSTSGSDRIPAWRNTNQDDEYSDAEKSASVARGDYATAILFHQAAASPPAQGCQVMEPGSVAKLLPLLKDEFRYLLVDDGDDVPSL